jgi:hypothetical protein
MFELFGIGKAWEGAFRKEPAADRLGAVAAAPISAAALRLNSAAQEASNTQRSQFQTASDALRDALGAFSRETKPAYTTAFSQTRSSAAFVGGASARVAPWTVNYGVLRSTEEVNRNESGVTRQSTDAIGLNLVEAASRLTSSGSLGLDVAGAASTIVSKAEMNTATSATNNTSSLAFSLGSNTSSSTGTLTGTMTGVGKAADATSLTVEIKRNATLSGGILGLGGTATVEFEVKDQTGEKIFDFNGSIRAGDQVYLGNDIGLSLSFSEGTLTKNHTSTVTLTRTPISVDGNATFNNANPSLRPQFDNNAQVTAGSFKVNGTTINVNADDSINSVISRINSSGAGVTASLSGDKITLVTNSNSDQDIRLENDTSGFLKATQLDGANTVKGDLRDDQRFLKDTSSFASVKDGSFQINGVTIAIDKDTDTLNDVLARINGSGAGVTASFNLSTNRVELVTQSASESLVVSNDTTGFLSAAKLSTSNTVRGNIRDDQQILSQTTQFAAVTTGSFTLNGVSISVNKDTDTLASIIDRVNNAGTGVTASYDAATDKLVFTRSGDHTLENDTSGFLAAANVELGTTAAVHEANPDAAFNGTGVNAPHFDDGVSVTAGAFTVNGVAISVAADDSINSVLAKITASAAGVTATYDATTELVTLRSKDDSTDPITVGADTSGFLAAVKLGGASSSIDSTSYSSFTSTLDTMSEYSGVTAGTLTINGQNIAIDPATTTIGGLIDAIDGLAGVAASLNEATGGINIWSDTGVSLTLSDTSGVLAALGVAQGTVTGTGGRSTTVTTRTGNSTTSNSIEVAEKASAAVAQLNEAFGELTGEKLDEALETFVGSLRDHGIRGFDVTNGDELGLSMGQDELVNALNALNDDAGLARTLASTFEQFSADVANAVGWDAPKQAAVQTLNLGDMSRAQLTADQALTSLLFLSSTLQPKGSEETTQKAAMKAYSESV